MLLGRDDRGRAVVDAELREHVFYVPLDRVLADEQVSADRGVRVAARHPLEDLDLAAAQRLDQGSDAVCGGGRHTTGIGSRWRAARVTRGEQPLEEVAAYRVAA